MPLVPAIVLTPVTSMLPPVAPEALKSLMVPLLMLVPDSVRVTPLSTCSVAPVLVTVSLSSVTGAGDLDRVVDGQQAERRGAVLEGDVVERDVIKRQRGIGLHRTAGAVAGEVGVGAR